MDGGKTMGSRNIPIGIYTEWQKIKARVARHISCAAPQWTVSFGFERERLSFAAIPVVRPTKSTHLLNWKYLIGSVFEKSQKIFWWSLYLKRSVCVCACVCVRFCGEHQWRRNAFKFFKFVDFSSTHTVHQMEKNVFAYRNWFGILKNLYFES